MTPEKHTFIPAIVLLLALAHVAPVPAAPVVKIVKTRDGYELTRNGKPYFVKGAGGSQHLDELAAAGGNSVRTWSVSAAVLDEAQKFGLTVLLGLPVGKPRHGFQYTDPGRVAEQFEQTRRTVLKYKDHPALLMWALGNEVELDASPEERIRIWKALNDLARMIKQVDGNHPVITVLAGAGRGKLDELKQNCPALDAVGINAYGGMLQLPELLDKQGWTGPYLITEFGPRGHWEVAKTPWGLPIEDTSTEKAEFYLKAYRRAIERRPNCLGSYVFLWGNKQEKTHTWYGMFLPDGSRLGPVDSMSYVWTGKWPSNRCPQIGQGKIALTPDGETGDAARRIFPAARRLHCKVDASDPDGDPLTVRWDLRLDVSDAPQRGGDREPPTPPIDGAVLSSTGNNALIRLPDRPGRYRIFVYVYDPSGAAATANVPVVAGEP